MSLCGPIFSFSSRSPFLYFSTDPFSTHLRSDFQPPAPPDISPPVQHFSIPPYLSLSVYLFLPSLAHVCPFLCRPCLPAFFSCFSPAVSVSAFLSRHFPPSSLFTLFFFPLFFLSFFCGSSSFRSRFPPWFSAARGWGHCSGVGGIFLFMSLCFLVPDFGLLVTGFFPFYNSSIPSLPSLFSCFLLFWV